MGRDQPQLETIEEGRENSQKMDENLILLESKIKEDLKHSLEVCDLEDLDCEEDICEGNRIISDCVEILGTSMLT